MYEELTSDIMSYIENDGPHYAIAIEGVWGSGKTRYIEEILSQAVGDQWKVVRISLFGLSSAADFYDRLVDVLLFEDSNVEVKDKEGNRRKRKSVLGSAISIVGTTALKQLKTFGVTYAVSSKMLVDFLRQDNMVLVFDDAERLDEEALMVNILGGINDLVEKHGQKVIFVTNDADRIPADVREKLIWKTLSFAPTSTDLVDEICAELFEEVKDIELDARSIVCEAAEAASCVNARAIIRALPLLRMLFKSPVLSDQTYALGARTRATTEIATFALQASMGQRVADSDASDDADGSGGAMLSMRVDERLARWQKYQRDRNYQDVSAVTQFFDAGSLVKQEEVDECLEQYLVKRYPVTEGTARLWDALNDLDGFVYLDDGEVEAKAKVFVEAVRGAGFSSAGIARAIDMNTMLRSLGFPALTDDEFESCARKVIDRDVVEAHRVFLQGRPVSYVMDTEGAALAERLVQYSDEVFAAFMDQKASIFVESQNADAGVRLSEFVKGWLDEDQMVLFVIRPTLLASSFEYGNAESQKAIHGLIRMLKVVDANTCDVERMATWLKEFKECLGKISGLDKLGSLRREWLMNDIDAIVATLERPSASVPVAPVGA